MEFRGEPKSLGLSEMSSKALGGDEAQSQAVLDALVQLFGTVDAPRLDSEGQSWNSGSQLSKAPADLASEWLAELRAGNRKRFEEELAQIARGDFDDLGPWKWAPQLSEDWEALIENAGGASDFGEQAQRFFSDYYPGLRDSAALYGNKCLHCHGNEGGGDGPTARTARPFPRDFRLGIFKYDNIRDGERPEREDLVRVITSGIEGTGMPSMAQLSPAQVHGLADFVRLLAMRGEVEERLVLDVEDGLELNESRVQSEFADILGIWRDGVRERLEAPTEVPQVDEARLRRGFEIFHDRTSANCASCHGTAGKGPGPAAFGPSPNEPETDIHLLRDAWGHEAIPSDLTTGRFRHGSSPGSIYERLALGIDGTPMAGIAQSTKADGTPLFSEDDLWSLVHYVRALSDPEWRELLSRLESEAP